MKVKNYPGIVSWPPLPGGAFSSNEPFPVDEEVEIFEVFTVINEFVTFTCEFRGGRHTYDLQMVDKATAEGFATWLKKYVGKTIRQFGEFRLDV